VTGSPDEPPAGLSLPAGPNGPASPSGPGPGGPVGSDEPPADQTPRGGTGAERTGEGRSRSEDEQSNPNNATYIFGNIYGRSNEIGNMRARQRARITSGGLSAFATVEADSSVFETDAMVEAHERLARDRLVVLVGPPDTGKHFGALYLLGCPERAQGPRHQEALGISAAANPSHIIKKVTRKNTAYFIDGSLLLGETADALRNADVRHDLDTLSRRLRSKGSFLVASIHADVEIAERVPYGVQWPRPDAHELFDCLWRHADPALDKYVADELYDVVDRLDSELTMTPRLVARLVDDLQAGISPDEAYTDIVTQSGRRSATEVTKWLDAHPDFDLVLYLAVVVFLGGRDESTLEREYADVRRRFGLTTRRDDDDDDGPKPPDPERYRRVKIPLLRRGESSLSYVPDRTIDLATESHRQAAVAELWARYGPDFWEPLCQWLAVLPRRVTLDSVDRVARGLGCLAGVAYTEVWSLLDAWWGGIPYERRCAARTVSAMASEERLANATLQRSMYAGRHNHFTPERAWTTDVALGGDLGQLFPADAVRALWARTRVPAAAGSADLSLWNLLAGPQAEPERSADILRYIRRDIRATEGAERTVRLHHAMVVIGARFQLDENVAHAALLFADQPEARRNLVLLLRAALCEGDVEAAWKVVTALVRRSRVVDQRAKAVGLLEEVARHPVPPRATRLRRRFRKTVQVVLRQATASTSKGRKNKPAGKAGENGNDGNDAVLREAFAEPPAGTALDDSDPGDGS
jgi:hypothetical protein